MIANQGSGCHFLSLPEIALLLKEESAARAVFGLAAGGDAGDGKVFF
jgi:hypothetical protein